MTDTDCAKPAKRQLTEEQLDKLRIARELAVQRRKERAKVNAMEKELKKNEQIAKENDIKERHARLKKTNKAAEPPEDDTPEDKSPEDEPPEEEPDQTDTQPVKKANKKSKKKPIVIVEESDSDSSSEQVVYIKRAKSRKHAAASAPAEPAAPAHQFDTWSASNCYGGRFYRR